MQKILFPLFSMFTVMYVQYIYTLLLMLLSTDIPNLIIRKYLIAIYPPVPHELLRTWDQTRHREPQYLQICLANDMT